MRTISFCPYSFLRTERTKKRHAFLAAELLHYWRIACRKNRPKPFLPFLLLICFSISIVLLILSLILAEKLPSEVVLAVQAAFLICIFIPLGWYSAWRRRKHFINIVFHRDAWISHTLLFGLLWVLIAKSSASYEVQALWLSALNLSYLLMILFQIIESHRSRKRWKHTFEENPALVRFLYEQGMDFTRFTFKEKISHIIGLFILICLMAIFAHDNQSLWGIGFMIGVSFLPLSILSPQRISSSFFWESVKQGVGFRSWESWHNISHYRLLCFHRLGVLTQPAAQLKEYWVDPSAPWSERELLELVYSLVVEETHPFCRSLKEYLKNNYQNPLFDSSEVESIPYIGIRAQLREQDGKELEVFLGNPKWCWVHEFEITSEGTEKWQEWRDQEFSICLLSCNRRIVASFAFETVEKEDLQSAFKDLKNLGYRLVLLSSQIQQKIHEEFEEAATNCLPLEREIQWSRWSEQVAPILQIQSYWDPSPTDATSVIQFQSLQRTEFPENAILVLKPELNALNWIFKKSRQTYWHYILPAILIFLVSIGLTAVLLSQLSMWLSVISLFSLSLLLWWLWPKS